MLRPAAVLATVFGLALAGCGSDAKDKPTAATTPAAATADTTAAPATSTAGCKTVEAPAPKGEQSLSKPKTALSGGAHSVRLQTNCGPVVIALDVKRAPKTAASFAALAKGGFFDGLTFHRIVPGFVVQGGDPLGTGEGGPGYSVTEAPPSSLKYTRGVVAMAKTGAEAPGTSGSQFFIVTGEDVGLPPEYALVGKVTSGMEAVDKIEATPTDAQDAPTEPVVIEKAELDPS
jgi:peptidyl-prolyl cis-trans isomerase B (cyclophilin B)